MSIAKAGWLYRQSSVLRRWKKSWFVLYQTGELSFFESQDSHQPEETIVLRAVCTLIKQGYKCDFTPPEGKERSCLLQLELRNDGDWKLCAESPDDMRAWQISLEEARAMRPATQGAGAPPVMVAPPGQVVYTQHTVGGFQTPGYPGRVLYQPPTQYVVSNAGSGRNVVVTNTPGTNVVYLNEPTYYNRGYGYGRPMFYPLFF